MKIISIVENKDGGELWDVELSEDKDIFSIKNELMNSIKKSLLMRGKKIKWQKDQ